MGRARRLGLVIALALGIAAALALTGDRGTAAQVQTNPYRIVLGWAQLPNGREMGAVGKIVTAPDGVHLWAIVRCEHRTEANRFGDECRDSKTDSILYFNQAGKVEKSMGGGMFIWPHGMDVDSDGNVYVTDAVASNRIPPGDKRGHIVVKFSPEGKVLMTLGTPGVAGNDQTHFNSPSDVAIAANGDIFVADGHGDNNNRVVKFDKTGKFLMAWGKSGWEPGQFHTLHAIAIDSRGRVFVGDRGNNRIQIFDQQGKSLTVPWTQFGKPSGISFDNKDRIYVADSESDDVQNPGWDQAIRIGDAKLGWVTEVIPYQYGDPRITPGDGAEFVTVDRDGNIYGGEPQPQRLTKYWRVRP